MVKQGFSDAMYRHTVPSSTALFFGAFTAMVVTWCGPSHSAEDSEATSSLSQLVEMSLEDLADIEISSVSKRKEKRDAAAAAIHVITQEDIRRAPATTIPGLLRMVPGLHVARLDANKWSVSSRGFSGRYANALLVLIDGRSVYTPFFSGVYWETRDVVLEDVERIEIIRGPGGALWGANAVNGVINIVTKSSQDTQGGLLSMGGGTEERGFGTVRYGSTVGKNGTYRIYGKYVQRDDGVFDTGRRANDAWLSARAGARFDWERDTTRFTLQGDVFGTDTSQTYDVPILRFPFSQIRDEDSYFSGGNLLGRWERTYANDAALSIQAYYDRSESNIFTIDEDRDTFDFELQYQFAPRNRHEIMGGVGFRYIDDRTEGSSLVSVTPDDQRKRLFSAFIQDRITLIQDKLLLSIGTKLEHNDFTGIEIQPSVRLAWTPNEKHTLWAAVSRAVRTPSLVESNGQVASQALPRILASLFGGGFESEELLAFEAGYRVRPMGNLSLDFSLFYNRYTKLRTLEFGLPFLSASPQPLHLAAPIRTRNNMEGDTYGLELALDWQPKSWWRVQLNYSFLEMNLDVNARTLDIISGGVGKSSPEQQAFLKNTFDLSGNMEIDVVFRYVDQLSALNVEDYLSMDLRFAWKPSDNFELSIIGQNLLDSAHGEFTSSFVDTLPTQVQRGVYGKMTWRF